MKQGVLETCGLTKYYGRNIGVYDLNLSVKQCEIFGFLGPNGAGKTTTIRLMLGLLKPSSGEIHILGKSTKEFLYEIMNDVGYLPGDFGLYKDMSGYDFLTHIMKLRKGKDFTDSLHKMKSLMCRFEIEYGRRISAYSKGMKQMIGIIQAFMHNPQIVILDEPTSGLDPIMQERFYELLVEEKNDGKTIFLSSHILSEVERICDRVGFVKGGKLINVKEIKECRSDFSKKVGIIPRGDLAQAFEMINGLAGVKNSVVKNDRVEFLYFGDMQTLAQRIIDIGIKDMVCEPPALEEIFFEYYEG